MAETINGLYKAEVIHRRGPLRSFEAVEYATLGWVDWFNHGRLLEPPACELSVVATGRRSVRLAHGRAYCSADPSLRLMQKRGMDGGTAW